MQAVDFNKPLPWPVALEVAALVLGWPLGTHNEALGYPNPETASGRNSAPLRERQARAVFKLAVVLNGNVARKLSYAAAYRHRGVKATLLAGLTAEDASTVAKRVWDEKFAYFDSVEKMLDQERDEFFS